jgi:hypothetical protein
MRARTGLSIFCLTLTCCGARSEIRGALPDASIVNDATTDEAAATPSCAKGIVEIAQTGSKPDTIVIDAEWVYWHDETGVLRAKKTGGAPETLSQRAAFFWPDLAAFAIGNGRLFDADGDAITFQGAALAHMPIPGFAASSSHVFVWSRDLAQSPVLRFDFSGAGGQTGSPIDGKAVEMTFTGPGVPCIALDPGVECDGGYLSGLTASDIVATTTDVWITSNDPTNGARVLHIEVPSASTAPIPDTAGAFAIAGDDTDLFFTDLLARRVRRIDGKTGPVVDIAPASATLTPVDVVVDDTCVYWTNASVAPNAPGAVMAAPKK